MVGFSDIRILLSREAVDRDLDRGIATNAGATQLAHEVRARLFGEVGELSLSACFERAATEIPPRLAVEMELQAWADEMRLVRLRAPGVATAIEGCLQALVGEVVRPARGTAFVPSAATVRVELKLGIEPGE